CLRVLVAGGSACECFFLDQRRSIEGQLQQILEQPDALRRLGVPRVHVGSVARSGVGTEALDAILAKVLPRYGQLDVLLTLVGASDVLLWLEKGAPQVIEPATWDIGDLFSCHPEGPFGWSPRRLALTEMLRRQRWTLWQHVDQKERAGRWIAKARR